MKLAANWPEDGGDMFLCIASCLSMGYTAQKTQLFMTTAVRTSNPT
jgi:hypothetical protein